jgi:hypothetical protein
LRFSEDLLARFEAVRLHALRGLIVQRGAIELGGGRIVPAARIVLLRERDQPVAHGNPALEELGGSGILTAGRRLAQRAAHLVDLADLRAGLDGDRHR